MVELYDAYTESLLGGHFSSFRKNLGNKLFIYGVSRVVAELMDCDFVVPENALIRREEQTVGHYVNKTFPFKGHKGKNKFEEPSKTMDDVDLYNLGGIDAFVKNYSNHKIIVLGYFTKYNYIKPYKELIKSYYQSLVKEKRKTNDLVIMLRNSRDDARFVLPDNYYLDILKKENFDSLYISLDHTYKHSSILEKLEIYNPKLIDGSILDVFSEVTSFNKIIASQGTFSFWACLLSNAEKIYWPMTNDGPNSNNKVFGQYVNLKVDDEPRYEFVSIDDIYKQSVDCPLRKIDFI
jgi:hypothetical protein